MGRCYTRVLAICEKAKFISSFPLLLGNCARLFALKRIMVTQNYKLRTYLVTTLVEVEARNQRYQLWDVEAANAFEGPWCSLHPDD